MTGRIIASLNEITRPMPIKSINAYLIARMNDRLVKRTYDRYLADMLYTLAQNKYVSGKPEFEWNEIEKMLLGGKKKNEEKMTRDEIIAKVCEMHSEKR